MQKKLRKIAKVLFGSGLAVLVLLAGVESARADDSENGCTFYSGFSMGTVNATTGYSLSGTAGLTLSGSGMSGTFTASGGISGTFMKCCVGSNAGSACNFANEFGGSGNPVSGTNCSNTAQRPARTAAEQVCP